jgi:NADH pyrophosphatase NudC (nudix superfamily)
MGAARRREMELNLHIIILAILTSAVGYMMVVAGLHKSMLEWRRTGRHCPSCGRTIESRVCSRCTGS